MERLSDERVAEVIALAEAATPGPWDLDEEYQPGDLSVWSGDRIVVNLGDDIVQVGNACMDEQQNGAFIVAARATLVALAREVQEHRARLAQPEAEREGTHRIESVRWSRSNDEELDGNVYGEPVTLLVVKGHIGPIGWDDAVRVVRASPPPTDREGAKDG